MTRFMVGGVVELNVCKTIEVRALDEYARVCLYAILLSGEVLQANASPGEIQLSLAL
jgi:hypothetical protein